MICILYFDYNISGYLPHNSDFSDVLHAMDIKKWTKISAYKACSLEKAGKVH